MHMAAWQAKWTGRCGRGPRDRAIGARVAPGSRSMGCDAAHRNDDNKS